MSLDALERKPQLIVFDLDYTLWPFWIDTNVKLPLRKKGLEIKDSRGRRVSHYPEVPQVLQLFKDLGIPMAIASRTIESEGADELLNLLGWNEFFMQKEMYPGRKIFHFDKLQKYTGLPYSSMIFFDDDYRNIRDISQLGVLSVLVKNGVSLELAKKGLTAYSQRRK